MPRTNADVTAEREQTGSQCGPDKTLAFVAEMRGRGLPEGGCLHVSDASPDISQR